TRHHPALPSFPTRRSSDLPWIEQHQHEELSRALRALPLQTERPKEHGLGQQRVEFVQRVFVQGRKIHGSASVLAASKAGAKPSRSEEHTSELQSRFDLVCR